MNLEVKKKERKWKNITEKKKKKWINYSQKIEIFVH